MAVHRFTVQDPSLESQWRSLILFGRNSATYKFAFAQSLLEFGKEGRTRVSLEELAEPYSKHLLTHLKNSDCQGTAPQSRFLDALRSFQKGELEKRKMLDATVKLGFVNVVDAFQNINEKRIPRPFYEKHFAQGKKEILLRDELHLLKSQQQFENLSAEVEARWKLVETAWNLDLNPALLEVGVDVDLEQLFVKDRRLQRTDLSSARDALNGYQKGKCFYSRRGISLLSGTGNFANVDHFLPHLNKRAHAESGANLDGVWNLVLAHGKVNGQKGAQVPNRRFLSRLHARNEFFIDSNHPLGKTIVNQTGNTEQKRAAFLNKHYQIALDASIHEWEPKIELDKTKSFL